MSGGGVRGLVPMAHVADLQRSIEFYARLGFGVNGRFEHEGRLVWAALACAPLMDEGIGGKLFISLASEPVDATQQAVLFYLYADDVTALRATLLAQGVNVSDVSHPEYMKAGEIRLVDPDGYVLLVGQL